MSSFSGSPGFYSGIELAVQVSGMNAVADFDAHVVKLKSDINLLQAQLQATGATVQLTAEMAKLADQLRQAEEAAKAAARVVAGMPASLDATQRSSRGAGQAFLEFSRGLEDFAVAGPLGALNNLPRVVGGIAQAFKATTPQIAAVEATASLLGTTAFLVYQNWGRLKKLFDDGLSPRLIDDIDSVTAALKELTSKEWKTRIDVQDMNVAQAKLDELTKSKKAFDAMNALTDDQKERGDAVIDAVKNAAGPAGKGREAVLKGVIAATNAGDSPEVAEARKKIDELNARIAEAEDSNDGDTASLYRADRDAVAESKEGRQATEMLNRRQSLSDQIGAAGSGDEAQRKWLEDLVRANPGKFKAEGVDTESFSSALGEASPQAREHARAVDDDEERTHDNLQQSIKEVKDHFKDLREAEKAAKIGAGRRANADVARVYPGMDDQLQSDMWHGITRDKATPDAMKAAVRGGVVRTLKGRGIEDDIIEEVADQIIQKASDAAQNLIAEGKKPKIAIQADQEAKKGEDAHRKAINSEVHRVAPGFNDAMEDAMLRRLAGGEAAGPALAALNKQLRSRLGGSGVPADIRGEVADTIIEQVRQKVANKVVTTDNPRRVAAEAVVHDQAKAATSYAHEFQARTGANDQQAVYAGRMTAGLVSQGADAETALQAVYAGMTGHLEMVSGTLQRMLASQDRMMSVIANATNGMGQIQARQGQLDAKINQGAVNANRNGMQRPSLMPNFGGL